MSDQAPFFIIQHTYVGSHPHLSRNIDSDFAFISNNPVYLKHDEITYNGADFSFNEDDYDSSRLINDEYSDDEWKISVFGKYKTFEDAQKAIPELLGEVRYANPYKDDPVLAHPESVYYRFNSLS